MHAATFALIFSQSWISAFGYLPCNSFTGLPCEIGGTQCCDDIQSGHYMWCVGEPDESYGNWGGISSCGFGNNRAYCVPGFFPYGQDYCIQGPVVLSLIVIEVTNLSLLAEYSNAVALLGTGVLVQGPWSWKAVSRHLIVVEMEKC
jgi:hypothetical protein